MNDSRDGVSDSNISTVQNVSKHYMTEVEHQPSAKNRKLFTFETPSSASSNSGASTLAAPEPPTATTFGYVDIKNLEHSARMLQKNIKLILERAPTIPQLNKLIRSKNIDVLTKDNLVTNKLVRLSSQLKSIYESNSLKIFDSILENDINPTNYGLQDLDTTNDSTDESESNFQSVTLNSPYHAINPKSALQVNESDSDTSSCTDFPDLPKIQSPHLHERVFIHKSTINNKSYLYQSELINSHNERLEFLGDSVLNNITTFILYNRYPLAPEGELSKMRSMLVNNVTLAEFSIKYGFDKKLRSNISDDILRQGKQKIFADIFEAYVGALAVENLVDQTQIKSWLVRLYSPKLAQFDQEIKDVEEVNKDAKSELYSLVGTAAFHPLYRTVKTGDGASKPFEVECIMGGDILGRGVAPGLKEAGLRAAMEALKNKSLLEKYTQLRLNTDKAQSTISCKQSTPNPTFVESDSTFPKNFVLPIPANDDVVFDSDARNRLYAVLSKNYNIAPEYICEETPDKLFCAKLKIGSQVVSFAVDASKKKAMARAARVVLDNSGIIGSLINS